MFVNSDPVGGAHSCYNVIRSTLNKRKNADKKKSPENIKEVAAAYLDAAIMDKFGMTFGSPRQLFYRGTVTEEAYGFTVFASPDVLAHVANSPKNHYHIDGTFALPHGDYKQLLVIHIAHLTHVS